MSSQLPVANCQLPAPSSQQKLKERLLWTRLGTGDWLLLFASFPRIDSYENRTYLGASNHAKAKRGGRHQSCLQPHEGRLVPALPVGILGSHRHTRILHRGDECGWRLQHPRPVELEYASPESLHRRTAVQCSAAVRTLESSRAHCGSSLHHWSRAADRVDPDVRWQRVPVHAVRGNS